MAGIDFNSLYSYNNISKYNYTNYSSKTSATDQTFKNTRNKPVVSQENQEYLSDVKKFSSQLKSAADQMLVGIPPVFKQMIAASENQEAMTVETDAAKAAKAGKVDTSVQIKQVATTQKNEGSSLNATGNTSAGAGYNTFAVQSGGKSVNISVELLSTDTNKSAQEKMAAAINKKDVGITASVQYDANTKKSTLKLESKDTGEKNAFTISDVAGRGNIVEALGVNNQTQASKDAVYSVDGGAEKKSASNKVDIGNGITATLKKANDNVKVGLKKDVTGITNSVYNLVNNYNDLLGTANDKGTDRMAQNLARQLKSAGSTYKTSLANIGITSNKDGYLKIDTDKLKTSIESGAAEKALANPGYSNYGFANKLQQTARSASSNPNQYLSKESKPVNNYNTSPQYQYMSAQYANMSSLFDTSF